MTPTIYKSRQKAEHLFRQQEPIFKVSNRPVKKEPEYFFDGNKIMYRSPQGIRQEGEVLENGDYNWFNKKRNFLLGLFS